MTELRTFAGLEVGESATAHCQPARIKKDHQHMKALSEKIDEFCNPFDGVQRSLVNLAPGRATTQETESNVLETLPRGQAARETFL